MPVEELTIAFDAALAADGLLAGGIRYVTAAAEMAGTSARLAEASERVEALRSEWIELAEAAAEPNSFAEHWFAAASFRHLVGNEDVRLLEVRRDGRLIGLLPLTIDTHYGRMPVRHVTNWLHHHSFLGTPLVRAGEEDSFWAGALGLLDASRWAPAFLHLDGLVENGPIHAALRRRGRACDTVLRVERALLETDLGPTEYYERSVRKKKRKELKRLANRLAELGSVTTRRLQKAEDVTVWCDDFLRLERAQWKGEAGSALACHPETEAFFREAVSGAHAAGRLDFLRMELDRQPIAMLVNFVAPPGAFSFKIAIDETYGRFSPGVLIQLENLSVLDRPEIGWMDSCAVEDHPMINSLWRERRAMVRLTVPLKGVKRRALFSLCRTVERGWARAKSLFAPPPQPQPEPEPCHD